MRILIVSDEAPLPPINGGRLQLMALLGELHRKHDVRVLAPLAPDQAADGDDPSLRLLPWLEPGFLPRARRLASGILRDMPTSAREMAALIRGPVREELERFRPDVVHVASTHAALLWRDLEGWPTVLAPLDAPHLNLEARAAGEGGLRGRLLRGEARRLARFESRHYSRFGRVVVVSDQDAAALAALDPSMRLEVVPNGVDVRAFARDESVPREPALVLFSGVMSYAPNVTASEYAAREIFPRVRRARPEARLAIVGRAPDPRVRDLGSLDGVEVWGEVPEMGPALSRASVYVCPMLTGTGIKNKLLEAMANGLPCVATPLALQGLHAVPGQHLLVGEGEELAAHVIHLLDDPGAAEATGSAGHEYVRANHSWRAVGRSFERIYRQVIEPG